MYKLQYQCESKPINSHTLEEMGDENGDKLEKYPLITMELDGSLATLTDLLDLLIIPFIQACGYKCDELYTDKELEEEISYRLKKEGQDA